MIERTVEDTLRFERDTLKISHTLVAEKLRVMQAAAMKCCNYVSHFENDTHFPAQLPVTIKAVLVDALKQTGWRNL
jgi:hypothetical protein